MPTKFKDIKDIGEAPLIGRHVVLREVCQHFQQSRQGTPKFLLLHGAQGMGKSRLVYEVRKTFRKEKNITFIDEFCEENDEKQPFLRIIHLLWSIYQQRGVLGKNELIGEPPPMMAHDFIEFAVDTYTESTLQNFFTSVESDWSQIYLSAICYIRSHAHVKPLCLVFEDIHHIDRHSGDFLFHLTNAVEPGDPLLVIGLYHGDEITGENGFQRVLPRFRGKKNFYECKIEPILAREIITFLMALVGPVNNDPDEIVLIHKATKGNPYLLIEFVRELAEQKKIFWQDEAWHIEVSKDLLTRPPKGLEEVLIKNLERQRAHHRKVLEWLAIADAPLSIEMLSALTGVKIHQIPYVLGDLSKEGYIIQNSETKKYAFSSNKVEQEVLNHLNEQQQQKFHLQFAKVLEKKYSGSDKHTILADHFHLGQDLRKTLHYSLQAGEVLVKQKRPNLALKYYRRAVEIARNQKKKGLIDILLDLAGLLFRIENYEEALKHFKEAESLASKENDIFRVKKGIGMSLYGLRRNEQALKELKNAMLIPRKVQDVETLLYLAFVELYRFQLKKSRSYLQETQANIGDQDLLQALQKKLSGLLSFYSGEWEEAQTCLQIAEDLFTELQSHRNLTEILFGKALLLANTEGLNRAWPVMHEAFSLLKDIDDWYLQFIAEYQTGVFYTLQNNIPNAKKHFRQLQQNLSKIGADREMGYAYWGLATCAFFEDLAMVEKLTQRALDSANTYNDKFLAADTYLLMSRYYLKGKKLPMALRYIEYSHQAFADLGCKWRANRLAVVYARIYIVGNKHNQAKAILEKASTYAQTINDHLHLAQNYFEMGFLLGSSKKFAEAEQWFSRSQELFTKLGLTGAAQDSNTNAKTCRKKLSK